MDGTDGIFLIVSGGLIMHSFGCSQTDSYSNVIREPAQLRHNDRKTFVFQYVAAERLIFSQRCISIRCLLALSHLITLSALASTFCGIVTPI